MTRTRRGEKNVWTQKPSLRAVLSVTGSIISQTITTHPPHETQSLPAPERAKPPKWHVEIWTQYAADPSQGWDTELTGKPGPSRACPRDTVKWVPCFQVQGIQVRPLPRCAAKLHLSSLANGRGDFAPLGSFARTGPKTNPGFCCLWITFSRRWSQTLSKLIFRSEPQTWHGWPSTDDSGFLPTQQKLGTWRKTYFEAFWGWKLEATGDTFQEEPRQTGRPSLSSPWDT